MNQDVERKLEQIESLLRHAASSFDYPSTPAFAQRVRTRLAEPESEARRPLWALAGAGILVAAVLALLAAIAVPSSRSALADFFHLSHVRIEHEQGGSPTPPVLAPSSFARPSSLDEARRAVTFPILLPTRDGKILEPDAVYLQAEEFNATIAIFVFQKASYDVYETRDAYIEKLVHGQDPVDQISFGGHDAYWIEAGGHIVQSLDAEGRVLVETRRTVDRGTLIWEQDGVTYRIESSLSQAQTVAVAESLR